jgi:hypothetical protein
LSGVTTGDRVEITDATWNRRRKMIIEKSHVQIMANHHSGSILTPPSHVVSLRKDCTNCVRNNGFATALSLIVDKGYNPSTYEDSL